MGYLHKVQPQAIIPENKLPESLATSFVELQCRKLGLRMTSKLFQYKSVLLSTSHDSSSYGNNCIVYCWGFFSMIGLC